MLGKRIRDLREAKGITVRQFAEMLGKTPGYISRVEARGEIPSPDLLCEMGSMLGADPEALLQLAKKDQLAQAAQQIDQRQQSALSLFRKGKK